MRILFLEPFFGGSHRDFAEGLAANSGCRVDLLTLPPRFWKWRMRGAALHFVQKIADLSVYDGLLVTSLMSLADFKALTGPRCPPALVYFHKTQLTYPLAPGERMDYHFGFTDITTALAADRVLFNSRTHMESFFDRLPGFLKMMPEYRPGWVVKAIRRKADFLHPGCRFPARMKLSEPAQGPPLIIWNHRWEFDKDPGTFFQALEHIAARGIDFRVVLLGENYQAVPKVFLEARKRFCGRIVHYGYEPSREAYYRWLSRGTVVVSTALQENFGISVVEAIRHGCLPLLPARLSYPEILPGDFHEDFLYKNPEELVLKLARILDDPPAFSSAREALSRAMARHSWELAIKGFDEELARLCSLNRRESPG